MAINNDYNKKVQNMPNSTVENSPVESPSVASAPASAPVPIVSDSNADVTKKTVEISEEVQQKADAQAQETREARANSHQNEVDEVAKMKAQSTSATTKEEKDAAEELNLKRTIYNKLKSEGKEPTEGDILNYLVQLELQEKLDETSKRLLETYNLSIQSGNYKADAKPSFERTNNVASVQPESSDKTSESEAILSDFKRKKVYYKERAEVLKDYKDIIENRDVTAEEKVFLTLKKYYSKHDAEFDKLSDKEQKAFINQKLNDEIMAGKKNLSAQDKRLLARDISTLVMEADMHDVPIEKLVKLSKDDITLILNHAKKDNYAVYLENLGITDDEKSVDIMLTMYLDSADENFSKLSPKERADYLTKAKDNLNSSISITSGVKKSLSKISLNVLKALNDRELNLNDFKNLHESEKNRILINALTETTVYKSLSKSERMFVDDLEFKIELYDKLCDGDETPTEGAIYEYLHKIENGELDTQYGKQKYGELLSIHAKNLLNDYKLLIKSGKFNPDEEVSFEGNFVKAKAAGLSIKEYALTELKDLKPGTPEYNNKVQELIKRANKDGYASATVGLIEALKEHCKTHGLDESQLEEIIDYIDFDKNIIKDTDGVASGKLISIAAEHSSDKTKADLDKTIDIVSRERDDKYVGNMLGNITHDPDNRFTDTATKAVSETRTKESALNIFKEAINMATPDRKAAITQSSIQTASKEQKLYYAQEYSQIKNSAVTQGLAAATHNETDTEIKSTLTSYVNYATQNNGYSSEEVNNINNALNTGYTSYSYNSASSDNRTSGNDSSSNTASTQNTSNNYSNNNSANSNSSNNVATNPVASAPSSSASTTPKTSSNSAEGQAKVVVSPQTQSKLNTMRDNLAQLQYNYSVQIRDKALGSLERIITHIQDDQQVRAQKQAEQKQELQKKEEIAKVLEEAQVQIEKGERVTVATEIVEKQIAKKFNIDEDTVKKLRNAAHEGDLSAIYSLLGSVNSRAQEHFILHISRKSESALAGFIRNHSNDKELIKMLIRLNPNLIKSIDSTLLINCGIEKAEIIKYADATQLKTILADLSKVGNKQQLKQFYDALGDNAQNVASEPPRGSDAWLKQRQQKMADASYSSTSTVVANSRFTDGQTRQKIRPQDVDYREFLA